MDSAAIRRGLADPGFVSSFQIDMARRKRCPDENTGFIYRTKARHG